MFEKYKKNQVFARLAEEQLYEKVAIELSNGQRSQGLWTKAISNSDGDMGKAEGLYIKYRVQAMRDEAQVLQDLAQQANDDSGDKFQLGQKSKKKRSSPKERFAACANRLTAKGYTVTPEGSGWVVNEPWGGKARIGTLAALEQYADLRA